MKEPAGDRDYEYYSALVVAVGMAGIRVGSAAKGGHPMRVWLMVRRGNAEIGVEKALSFADNVHLCVAECGGIDNAAFCDSRRPGPRWLGFESLWPNSSTVVGTMTPTAKA